MIGSSGRDAVTIFEREKDLVKSFVERAKNLNAAFGVIQYDSTVRNTIELTAISEIDRFKQLVDNLKFTGQGTGVDKPLKEKTIELFVGDGRSDARRIVIVFVNDPLTVNDDELTRLSRLLKGQQVEVFVVGYGNRVDVRQINLLISNRKNFNQVGVGDDVKNTSKIIAERPLTGLTFVHILFSTYLRTKLCT